MIESRLIANGRSWFGWRGIAVALLLGAAYVVWTNMGQALTMHLRSDNVVMDLLGSPAEFVWSAAIATAIERHDHIIPLLADRIRGDSSTMVRARAAASCRRIAMFKPQARQSLEQFAVPALKEALSDASMLVQASSARALWRIEGNKSDLLPILRTVWRKGDQNEKYAAMQATQEIVTESHEMAHIVAASLNDPDALIRQWATYALGAIQHDAPKGQ